MMILGIVLHAGGFYVAAPPPTIPVITDRNTSYVFDLLFHFIHSFRMPLFFVLAGFFASLLVEKRGLWGTYKNRLKRIVAPMLAAIITVLPITGFFAVNFMLSVRFGTHEWLPDLGRLKTLQAEMKSAGVPVDEPSIAHLWFLYYLCYFYLLIPLCQWLVRRPLVPWLLLVIFMVLTVLSLWPFRGGQVHEGFLFLKPHLPSLAYYGLFFVFGYVFHHHRDFLQALARHVPALAALAVVLFPLSLYVTNLEHAAPGVEIHLAAVVVHALCTWTFIYLFTGSALRFFDHESPWTLYISQSSYWVFLVHLPAVCFAGWWMAQYDLPAMLKFLAVVAFTTVVCFVTYHYWVQNTRVSVFLNGKRFNLDWPWRKKLVSGTTFGETRT